jgi:alpha-tubulin suppressor-like RCC1 family protein
MGGTTTTGGTGGQVTTPDVASKVVVFDSGTCALLTTGTVRCWGFNVQGELGSPLANFVLTPTAVEGIGGVGVLSNVTDLAVGVAVSASQVVYWPQQTGTYTYNATPVAVPGITNATAVASADTFLMSGSTACALLADGTVTCWQAGKTPVPVSGLTGAVAIGTGVTHGCALTSSGTVACWGSNVWGELGNGQTSLTTTMTASQVGGLTDILALYVGGGDENACALRADLTVLCWGNDAHWEFGSATAGLPTANPFSPTPVPVNELHGASFVALGTDHSCAIFADGSVQCSTPTAPSLWSTVTGVSNAVALSTCSTMFCGHSCALIADGSIKCWGQDGSGELGDGNYSPTHNSIYESAVTVKGL